MLQGIVKPGDIGRSQTKFTLSFDQVKSGVFILQFFDYFCSSVRGIVINDEYIEGGIEAKNRTYDVFYVITLVVGRYDDKTFTHSFRFTILQINLFSIDLVMCLTKKIKNRAVFFDRDGVINVDRNDYTYLIKDFELMPDILEVMQVLKDKDFLLIVITNQAGIAKGIYTDQEVDEVHAHFQGLSEDMIDAFYHAPGHPNYSETLSRKPDSLLFEKAIAKFNIDPGLSWMIGDKERDLIPAKKLGLRTILLGEGQCLAADFNIKALKELPGLI